MKRILAIDYGDVRVGLAVSDPLGITAQGLETLVINNSEAIFLNGIKSLIKEFDVNTIVIGNPKNMDGTNSEKTKKVLELVPKIEKLGVQVILWDERLTTVSAYKTMIEMNIKQKQKNTFADKFAAIYILEGYLKSKKYTTNEEEI